MIKIVNGDMQVFGMSVPKALVISILLGAVQALQGNAGGAIQTILIGVGIQKGGDSLQSLIKQ